VAPAVTVIHPAPYQPRTRVRHDLGQQRSETRPAAAPPASVPN